MNPDFILALDQIAEEKKIDKSAVLEATEAALAAAYRKDYGKPSQIVKCKIDPEKGSLKFWLEKKVVEAVADENSEISLEDAKKEDSSIELEGIVKYDLPTHEDFGRIAAQTAKQVIIQRLKEVEREVVFNEFKNMEGQMVNGVIQQIEGGNIIVDLGRVNGVMFPSEQITGENYRVGQRTKVILLRVEKTNKGSQILVSRAHEDLIRYLFMMEVPEIENGSVEIMGIAREAGVRTKMAVRALQEGVDPVGSCVGQRGTRVQAVLSEIGNEKIDIILWNEDAEVYITNALSPAKIEEVALDQEAKETTVYVTDEQLSLAIGKNGQNVRLASKLTGWKIDVLDVSQKPEKPIKQPSSAKATDDKESKKAKKQEEKQEEKTEGEEKPVKKEKKVKAKKEEKEEKPKKEAKAKKKTTKKKEKEEK